MAIAECRCSYTRLALRSSLPFISIAVLRYYFGWSYGIQSVIAGCLLAYSLFLVDELFIWPYFSSPLNRFPTTWGAQDLWTLTFETPRGETALKWMKQYPDADVYHMRSRLGFSTLIPITPEGFRDIMCAAQYDIEKPLGLRQNLAHVLGWGLILTEGEEHKRQRKALTPAFSLNNIRNLYPLMWEKAEQFSTCVKKEADKDGYVEIKSWASKLTVDIIGQAALSQDFEAMKRPDCDLLDSFEYILNPGLDRQVHLLLSLALQKWFVDLLPFSFMAIAQRHCDSLRATCHKILANKKKAMQSGKQLNTDMLRDIIVSDAFTDDQVVDQMLTFIAAGHETTACALTWSCYMMTQNPECQEKLYEELAANLPNDNVDSTTFDKLPYLNGVCEEVLRLFPTVPTTVREVKSDTMICGVPVPRRTLIVIVMHAVNRNPQFWGPDAEKFEPSRWIDTAADGSMKSNKHGGTDSNLCGMTFLHGSRSCIGRDFAKAELKCAVANLFSKYRVSMWDPKEKIRVIGSITTTPDVGMKVKLAPR